MITNQTSRKRNRGTATPPLILGGARGVCREETLRPQARTPPPPPRIRGGGRKSRGFATIELLFTLPILGIILMGLVEFSMLFYARSSLVEASRCGARAASLAGIQPEQIEWEVRKVLGLAFQDDLEIEASQGARTGDAITVGVRVPMNAACPDLLWPIGYSLRGRFLYSQTSMIKE